MPDKLSIEILEDGTIKIITDGVSMPNHTNAEGLLRQLAQDMGGDAQRTKRAGHQVHEHDGVFHSH